MAGFASQRIEGGVAAFASLQTRDFRLLYVGITASGIGLWLHVVALSWFVWEATESPLLLGVATAARTAPSLVFPFVGGLAADRYDMRLLLRTANVVGAVGAGSSALAISLWPSELWVPIVLALLMGAATATEIPVRHSALVDLVGADRLSNAIALNSVVFNSARVIGPMVGGATVAAFGVQPALLFTAVLHILTILAIRHVRLAHAVADQPVAPIRAAIAEAVQMVAKPGRTRVVLGALALHTVLATNYVAFAPAIADRAGGDAGGLGILMASAAAGAITAGLAMASNPTPWMGRRLLLMAGLTSPLAQAAGLIANSLPLLSVMFFLTGWAGFTFTIAGNALVQTAVPRRSLGRAMSWYAFVMVGLVPVGSLLCGALAVRTSLVAAILLMLGVWVVASLSLSALTARDTWTIPMATTAPSRRPADSETLSAD